MIAIHNSKTGFHPRWVDYCRKNNIPFKIVDCYANDLIYQLRDCNGLMWHHHHQYSADLLVAKQILLALEHAGIKVFPDIKTGWHFDDKVAQKYLLEATGAPLVPSFVFYDKAKAMAWAEATVFPKVFKTRGGAGSVNVKLIRSKHVAKKTIKKAFGKGFEQYDSLSFLKEAWYKFRKRKGTISDVLKAFARIGIEPAYSKTKGRERGYVYFQEFMPNNQYDIRVIVIGDRAFALKRIVRENDFRASGSGKIEYAKDQINEECVKIAFQTNNQIKAQSIAFDFVFDANNNPLIVEISYGYAVEAYDPCPGYWDSELNWYEGQFNPQEWMVENLLREIQPPSKKTS